MNVVQARRLAERNIARNPTSIVIKRIVDVDDGAGGSYKGEVELPAQTMRIFLSSMNQTKDVVGEGGQLQVQRWGLLAKWDADIQVDDKFEVDGRRFRVRSISLVRTGGVIVSHQVDLEEVS